MPFCSVFCLEIYNVSNMHNRLLDWAAQPRKQVLLGEWRVIWHKRVIFISNIVCGKRVSTFFVRIEKLFCVTCSTADKLVYLTKWGLLYSCKNANTMLIKLVKSPEKWERGITACFFVWLHTGCEVVTRITCLCTIPFMSWITFALSGIITDVRHL